LEFLRKEIVKDDVDGDVDREDRRKEGLRWFWRDWWDFGKIWRGEGGEG
jgi:hypothetical protein